jgi:hypothetical protein
MSDTIKLQGINGQRQGTKVKDLKVGCVLVWNFGYKSEVVEILPSKTGKTYTIKEKSFTDGVVRDRKMGANRLVVAEQVEEQEEEKTPENPIDNVQKAIDGRKRTYNSIYSDIGVVLDQFSTLELAEHLIKICGTDSSLRYYIEEQITKHEINKERAV